MIYHFGDYELDTGCFELRQAGAPIKVEPQVFALLELLIANHGRLISKEEINLHVWGGRIVSEAVVNSRVRAARQAIGDNGKAQELIRTVHGRGFRFVAAVASANDGVTHVNEAADAGAPSGEAIEAASAGRPSIAVLPLLPLTHDERYGALGDAVSQEIIIELARLHWLFVIARGSSFRYRDPGLDLAEAGRVLGARYILSGTIGITGRRAAVTVELAHAQDGQVIWAERYDCPLDELIQLRTAISSHIVTAIESRIQIAEAMKAAKLPSENLDAWSAYHRGLWHMYRFNRHDNEIAARMFDRAVTADPNFARAYAGLSFTHFQNVLVGYSNEIEHERSLTRRFADKCMDLDPMDPFVNLTMGRAEWISGDFSASLPWFERSVEISPNFAFAHYNRGLIDALLGEGEQSEENVKKAMALSPIDPLNYAMLATRALSHFVRGDYEAAADWSLRAIRSPNAHVHIYVIAAMACDLCGRKDESQRQADYIRATTRTSVKDGFLRSFSFRKDDMLALTVATLTRLNI